MPELAVRVAEVVAESALDRTYVLEVDDKAPLTWVPGQCVSLLDPAAETPKQRWYSLSSATKGDGRFEVTVRAGSAEDIQTYGFRVGQSLVATPPEGAFTLAFDAEDHLLLLAAGSGVAPFRAFVQHVRSIEARPTVTLVQTDRTPSSLLFRRELSDYAGEGWLRYVTRVTGDDHGEPWDGATGRIGPDDVEGWVTHPDRTTVYACGPGAFVDRVLEAAGAAGVPSDRLRREGWG